MCIIYLENIETLWIYTDLSLKFINLLLKIPLNPFKN